MVCRQCQYEHGPHVGTLQQINMVRYRGTPGEYKPLPNDLILFELAQFWVLIATAFSKIPGLQSTSRSRSAGRTQARIAV